MRIVKMIALGLLVLPLAEITAFLLVVAAAGFWTALGLLVLVSLSGLLILREVGAGAMSHLRAATGNAAVARVTLDDKSTVTALAGILLIIPGFITGLLGLLVAFPLSRGWLLNALRGLAAADRGRAGQRIIDLSPDEWEPLLSPKLPPRKRRRGS
jgi:UPF0716 protein FxsA